MTPAPPAERPHGPGDPPIESPFMTIFSRSQDLRKPWKLAVKRLNYMKTAITSNVTAFASFRIRASGLRLSQFSRTEPPADGVRATGHDGNFGKFGPAGPRIGSAGRTGAGG